MLANAIAATVLILATWVVYALVILGFSTWYMRAFLHNENATFGDFFTAFWVGLATLLGLLQLWHFFAPIDSTAYIALISIGILGFLSLVPDLWRALRNTPSRPFAAGILMLALIAIWLANRATGLGAEYDSGLYHIAAIKWTLLYRIVPGLANLHMRFGFSSTITLLAAWMDHGPWAGNANHIVNGFFLAALAAAIIRSALRDPRIKATLFPRIIGCCSFSGILVIDWGTDIQASSYSTDISAMAPHHRRRPLLSESVRRTRPRAPPPGLVCAALSAAAVTAKASTLILCAPMTAIILVLLWRTAARPQHKKPSLPCLLASTFLIVP